MPYSERNGVKTYYDATGEGMPFVMLHANPCDHWMWSYQIASFSHRFRVIAPDMRGYGRTDKPLALYPFDALVEDVLGVLEQEGVENGILAGASMGSKMAFKLAADRPGLFQAHIHVGGNAFRGTSYDNRIVGYETEELAPYRANHLKELFAPGFADTERGQYICRTILQDTHRMSGKAIATLFHSFDDVDLAGQVPSIAEPTLIVNGEYDNSLQGGQKTAALIKGAGHEVIRGAGHLCILENPAAFDALVIAFLTENGLYPDQ
jgi:3-oxoadipate enol-lactonase